MEIQHHKHKKLRGICGVYDTEVNPSVEYVKKKICEAVDIGLQNKTLNADTYCNVVKAFDVLPDMTVRRPKLDATGFPVTSKESGRNVYIISKIGKFLSTLGFTEKAVDEFMRSLARKDSVVITVSPESFWLCATATTGWDSCHGVGKIQEFGNAVWQEDPFTAILYVPENKNTFEEGIHYWPIGMAVATMRNKLMQNDFGNCAHRVGAQVTKHHRMCYRAFIRLVRTFILNPSDISKGPDKGIKYGIYVDRMFPSVGGLAQSLRLLLTTLPKHNMSLYVPSGYFSSSIDEISSKGDVVIKKNVLVRTHGTILVPPPLVGRKTLRPYLDTMTPVPSSKKTLPESVFLIAKADEISLVQ